LGDDAADPPREHVLHARYDGDDLARVAEQTGLSVAQVIERHAATTYTVDTIGFRPGFAYLSGLDPTLVLPRRATPRSRVPAGSLAIADEFTAVYPGESPGGWHLIGRVAEAMFGPGGARLQLGDRVRFTR
ncbi:MAG TPA: carboxyltransferase domain-containing protein, partial [Kofleriaceae bacterium]|nr:carboxyltransferase domain-containing protein [Kofleriaceae bacterium]